ncbi:hypothetical protein M8J76_014370 [Diaphorina citri]|nr:hypothetical protein M8J76_014370 [Diaphorina citri]
MACNKWAAFKLTELIMCLVCLIYKWITDEEASRLFYLLEKISREWPLLNNITWNRTGDMFADVTFGSYAIICLGLLISSCSGELGYMRKTETVLLGIGVLMFFGVGCMVLASIDSIPHNLVDNAVILGTLTLLTGLLFLLDMGVTGNRHKSRKGQDTEFRLKRNIPPLVPSVPSESGIKKIDLPPPDAKPEASGAAYQNVGGPTYQNGGFQTSVPIGQNGFPVNQNGYQNAVNQSVAAQSDPSGGYVRDGIVEPSGGAYGRGGVNGVSYTNGIKPMGELRSSMKKREMARLAEKERSAQGRTTPDGYRMSKDDSVAKAEYLQMGKKYTTQDFDLNRELIQKEREKENLEFQNKYYDQREMEDYDLSDKTYSKRASLGRNLDYPSRLDRPDPKQYDGYNRRDKKQAAAKRLSNSSDEDLDDRELARLSKRYRHYDSSDYDDETLQQTNQAARKLAQEHLQQRALHENKKNYHKQKSADELLYATRHDSRYEKSKRSKTPDYDSQWRKEQYDNKYYHSENEKDDHQAYLGKEKKSLQQWRFSQDLYKDNWRQQIQQEEKALNFPKPWKPPSDGKYYGVSDIPPPSKFEDAAKYKSDSDDSLANIQIPSVSFLMSERGKKIKPTITPSPIKTIAKDFPSKDYHRDRDVIEDRITPQSAPPAPKKFFFNSVRSTDDAPKSSRADDSARMSRTDDTKTSVPTSPRDPGFVRQLASTWEAAMK